MKTRAGILAATWMVAASVLAQSEAPPAGEGQPEPYSPPPQEQEQPGNMQMRGPHPMRKAGGPGAIQRGPGSMRQGEMAQRGPGGDPMMENLYPPELVMQSQQAIGLTDEQKNTIRDLMKKFMGELTGLQWQMSSEQQALSDILKKAGDVNVKIDETKVLDQLDKLMKIENQVKRLHLSSMIQIRNSLTAEQLTKLGDIKKSVKAMGRPGNAMHQGGPDGGGMGGHPMPPDQMPQE